MSTNTTTVNRIVLHGKTRWSESLSDYEFRPGITHTVTFGTKQPITHKEHAGCLNRSHPDDLPTPVSIATTKKRFEEQVKLEEAGEDRTAWFCTRCLIFLPKEKRAAQQVAAQAAKANQSAKDEAEDKAAVVEVVTAGGRPKSTTPVGGKVTRPRRTGGRKPAAAKKA